ncbi:LacI family transcriptional regulator [Oceanotoga sp. DSM 15011]|jgi:LacI family transcriptional regulator|uniref:LacI family transcriptional regulator n=1 Tax=Oceanotoga teriensis TaxID=515440 RepID=A0AA45C8E6_9BACT|nr:MULTISPECIES: LacI family DNA-binding transcriptional regulator [Oceanotoga]MDO7976913.1 LacI family transcriptional regulator [Oceanotoga teriensis]PWJ95994.1 LacI family transcriptional regulator [Oceanotoga teriensis]UYP00784.1 LacI family transcriptional regulator [Oceanotoga sp. DSM 15011]
MSINYNSYPTIKDVAKKANVGIATVSRVLNNSEKVSEKTRKRVLQIVEDLGYSPNLHARSLSSKKGNSVSLVVPSIGNEVYATIYSALEKELSKKGYRMIVFPLMDNLSLQKIKQKTDLIYQTDGVFIASLCINKIFKDNPPNKKIVLIDSFDERFDSVHIDNFEVGVNAAKYLLQKQKDDSDFFLISYKEVQDEFTSTVFENRDRGFVETLEKNGKKPNIIYTDLNWDSGFKLAKRIASKKKHNLIFSTADKIAFGLKAFFDQNIYTPDEDYNMISVDDLPFSKVTGLTTIRQPFEKMAKEATNLYFSYIEGNEDIKNIKLKTKLIIRET